jgi:hypothetical protein
VSVRTRYGLPRSYLTTSERYQVASGCRRNGESTPACTDDASVLDNDGETPGAVGQLDSLDSTPRFGFSESDKGFGLLALHRLHGRPTRDAHRASVRCRGRFVEPPGVPALGLSPGLLAAGSCGRRGWSRVALAPSRSDAVGALERARRPWEGLPAWRAGPDGRRPHGPTPASVVIFRRGRGRGLCAARRPPARRPQVPRRAGPAAHRARQRPPLTASPAARRGQNVATETVATVSLGRRRRDEALTWPDGCGAPGDRTRNPRIKSPLLCQLS